MVGDLKEMGIEPMVSVWLIAEEASENYQEMLSLAILNARKPRKRPGQILTPVSQIRRNPDARE